MRYFEAFPTINYQDQKVRNLLTRVKFLESAKNAASVYHPFTIRDGETASKIAYDYYDSTDYQWIIWLVNNIVDPYYDWPLDTVEFEGFLRAKYGSLEAAQAHVQFYRKSPTEFLININDPTEYHLASAFIGDASGYTRVYDQTEIRISEEAYLRSPDPSFYPVDAYSHELEKNEAKRNIRLLDRSYTRIIEKELKEILS